MTEYRKWPRDSLVVGHWYRDDLTLEEFVDCCLAERAMKTASAPLTFQTKPEWSPATVKKFTQLLEEIAGARNGLTEDHPIDMMKKP